jgi:hypothetical protein
MKAIGIATRDFRAYYELLTYLKRGNTPFLTFLPGAEVPREAGVVITTAEELDEVEFDSKVVMEDYDGPSVRKAIAEALRVLGGKDIYRQLIIGIDPGKFPGIAVVADGAVVETHDAENPEAVHDFVAEVVDRYPFLDAKIRIGHGDPMNRNRIINSLLGLGLPVEITDESSTSNAPGISHTDSAAEIAQIEGRQTWEELSLSPSHGLIRDIQRKSRLKSEGELTISGELAALVAKGELTLAEAIDRQREQHDSEEGEA